MFQLIDEEKIDLLTIFLYSILRKRKGLSYNACHVVKSHFFVRTPNKSYKPADTWRPFRQQFGTGTRRCRTPV